jgi:hypothetical protein
MTALIFFSFIYQRLNQLLISLFSKAISETGLIQGINQTEIKFYLKMNEMQINLMCLPTKKSYITPTYCMVDANKNR